MNPSGNLHDMLNRTFDLVNRSVDGFESELTVEEVGKIVFVGQGIVRVTGLSSVRADELLLFSGERRGLAFNVSEDEVGVVMLDENEGLSAGEYVYRTQRVLDTPVGEGLLARVVDAQGRPLDEQGPIEFSERWPVERPSPPIMDRAAVTEPLQTGLKVVDALLPIGRGQRELILGDRQTGKSAVALDAILNQSETGVICIYCGIGKRSSQIAKAIQDLRDHDAMRYSIVVVSTEEDPPGLQYVTPYAAMSMAEYFMERGKDVLIVLDDLTRHARAYREVSLLLRRPPGREAYPGDIFYIHSRLLERSTHLNEELGGGSITCLPIVETEAQNISAYIPTNIISITDGQIYLSPQLFQKGVLPAVDVGRSVSRVGGKTQLKAYRTVAGDLRLAYSQFEEMESFARFGTRLDEETKRKLERGRRVREILKQSQGKPLTACDQISSLVAVNMGVMDELKIDHIARAEDLIREGMREELSELCKMIESGEKIGDEEIEQIRKVAEKAVQSIIEGEEHADTGEPEA